MKKIFIITTTVLLANASFGQVQANSELKGLINQSFGYFPAIKEASNNVVTAQRKIDIAQIKLPEVNGNASYEYVKPKIEIPFPMGPNGELQNFQFAPVHNGNANVSAEYTLFDFGRIKADVEKAKSDLQYAKDNVDYNKDQLAYQVANIYYNIVYIQKALAIEDSVLTYLNENKRVIESKLKNGDAIKIDLLNIQASIDEDQNRKIDLNNQLQKQLNLLAYTTGSQTATGTSFDFVLPLKDVDGALAEAQANNLEFVLAKDKITQSQRDVDVVKLDDKPKVNLNASTGYKNGYVPNVNELRFNYQAGISLKVPIYNGNKTKKQVLLAQSTVRQNELHIDAMNNNYKKDIAQALSDIRTFETSIQNTVTQIEQTRTAQQIASSRFMNGTGTNLDITNASGNYQRALLTQLQYTYKLCMAKVDLARIMGYRYW
ncbi:MAG: TolC family protein [Filimonas sp.]|nr:TolC family protein [Filimonas sp.]